MNKQETIHCMNEKGRKGEAFFFLIDYEMKHCHVYSKEEAAQQKMLFNFNGERNYPEKPTSAQSIRIEKESIDYSRYKSAFDLVMKHLKRGNSYLVNLTMPTPLVGTIDLNNIFHLAKAKYKLLLENKLVVYSPETFVRIENGKIFTHPMKGTIDAATIDAENQLMHNKKELAEHATIVDLLRNDLSMVAKDVRVDKFRYVDHIKSGNKNLLQVSSKISGQLTVNYNSQLGDIIFHLLPAGSISGAPKTKTLKIIQEAEQYQRGYYTGIAGYFDGKNLDSGVMIRYIEKIDGQYFYKSGGGITSQSKAEDEFNELNDKIYVPAG